LNQDYALAGPQEGQEVDVRGHDQPTWPRWLDVPARGTVQRLLVVVAGETFRTPRLGIGTAAHMLHLSVRVIPAEVSADGLDVHVRFVTGGRIFDLLRLSLASPACPRRQFCGDVSLEELAGQEGQLELECSAGALGIPDGDWLGIESLVIGHGEEMPLLRARTHHAFRLANELQHFPQVYAQPFYDRRTVQTTSAADANAPPADDARRGASRADPAYASALERLNAFVEQDAPADINEDAFGYLQRLLQGLLPDHTPDFGERMRHVAPGRETLRVLSLLSGMGRVEKLLASTAVRPLEITFMDANAELLQEAAKGLPGHVSAKVLVGDINRLDLHTETFDVAICVSGLHHVVELEAVLRSVQSALTENGEFWVVGEQVGRNGNRLWRAARETAELLFARLPEELRLNKATGRVDAVLPCIDHATSMFEGVRSQDIESVLADFFEPVQLARFNCFAWMFIDRRYHDNYDLRQGSHRQWLRQIAAADLAHWLDGGRSSELHGVFKPRRLRRLDHQGLAG